MRGRWLGYARAARRWPLVALGTGLLAACSLLTSYDGLLAGGGPPDGGRDATGEGPDDASEPDDAPAATWTLTALSGMAPDDDAGCPPGFGAPTLVMEGLDAGGASCSCGCTVTTSPSCSTGIAPATFGLGTCNVGPFALTVTGGCTSIGSTLASIPLPSGYEVLVVPAPPSGGACEAKGVLDPASVSYARTSIACTGAPCPSDGGVCVAPVVPPGFVACISMPGDAPCPEAPPFTTRHRFGTAVGFSCGAGSEAGGGCGCSMEAGCPATTATLFTDTECSDGGLPIVVNGMCDPTAASGNTYKSFVYEGGVPTNVACVPMPASPQAATVTLEGIETLCCAK